MSGEKARSVPFMSQYPMCEHRPPLFREPRDKYGAIPLQEPATVQCIA